LKKRRGTFYALISAPALSKSEVSKAQKARAGRMGRNFVGIEVLKGDPQEKPDRPSKRK